MTGPLIPDGEILLKSSLCTYVFTLRFHRAEWSSSEPDIDLLPLSDPNAWYYPSHGYTSDDEEAHAGTKRGNWGNKTARGARWVRRGKLAAWGPPMEDWEVNTEFPQRKV